MGSCQADLPVLPEVNREITGFKRVERVSDATGGVYIRNEVEKRFVAPAKQFNMVIAGFSAFRAAGFSGGGALSP